MFDTTIFEKYGSIAMLFTLPMTGFMLPGIVFLFAAIAADGTVGYGIAGGLGCCGLVGGILFTAGLLWLMKWSRSGRARPFLQGVVDEIGGEIRMGSLVWSLLSPRLTGEFEGHDYRFTLRRQGGVLSAADPGKRFLIWGWAFDMVLTAPWKGTAGFGPEGMPQIGLGLFGISGPRDSRDGVETCSRSSCARSPSSRPERWRSQSRPSGPRYARVLTGGSAIQYRGTGGPWQT